MTTTSTAPATGRRTTYPVMGDHTMGIHPRTAVRHAISSPPWAVIGYRKDGRPIHPIAGGAEDDDVIVDDDPEPDPDDTPDDDPEPDPAPKPKPPAKKPDPKPGDDDYVPPSAAEWARTQAALRKANEDGKRHRLRNRELEDAARANETEHDKAVREAREAGEKRFREPMKRAGMRAALAEAGFAAPDRLLKLVDWDAVTVDDEGDVIGAETEADRIRKEYPELAPQDKPKPKPRPTAAPKPAAESKAKSSAELHAARVLGKS